MFKFWAAAGLSAALLELPFPLAGPLPAWRTVFAWFGLVPLLWAILSKAGSDQPRPLRRAFLLAYFCGILWYAGNCYWVRDVMGQYGDMPPTAPTLLLLGFSMVLGLYFGLFGLGVGFVKQATGSTRLALTSAPIFWAALELAASRITSVPWDQLGYSQVDNSIVNELAPWTGVYGISFLLVAVNALIAGGLLLKPCEGRRWWGVAGAALLIFGAIGVTIPPPTPAPTALAVLVQPNLDVTDDNRWLGPGEWDRHIAEFTRLASGPCGNAGANGNSLPLSAKTYIAGIPQTGAPNAQLACPPSPTHPDLVVWPESPAPFIEEDTRFQQALASVARQTRAPFVVGSIGTDYISGEQAWHDYNSALVIGSDGSRIGRYDKIHLVPFGEYIPFQNLLTFAHKLTGRVSSFTRGAERKVFLLPAADGTTHRYGVFICYESVFADEVRQFANSGAEVLVNISDDGWYGDTSAPWQHLNMERMRAIENRRWILRDTNNGVTASIDPNGVVRQSIPRHTVDALPARYAFRSDITFYTAHGDLFAWACVLISAAALLLAALRNPR
jgi:apolipoprotein N-acyltransferase